MAELLQAAACIPIAQLSPNLSAPPTKSIKAIVTLIWPYSSSNASLTVLLAEPDFRLRKVRGQVRVQFAGSSARIVFEAGIGSGDEIILSLDGAEWVKHEATPQTPGRGIEWDLKYTEKLVLQIEQSETKKISLVDIDHPLPASESDRVEISSVLEAVLSTPNPPPPSPSRPKIIRSETNEWTSPAFIKRARVSYGSLFESGYDMFADIDESIPGKGRKRTRFNRESGSWRYSSRSVSPVVQGADGNMVSINSPELKEEPIIVMTDEGCQTLDFEEDGDAETVTQRSERIISDVEEVSPSKSQMADQEAVTQGLVSEERGAEASNNMPPPPKSQFALEANVEEEQTDEPRETYQNEASIVSLSPRLRPVPSDALPLVSPLISSALDTSHAQYYLDNADTGLERGWYHSPKPNVEETAPLVDTNEAEDLYGLSPAANDYGRALLRSNEVEVSITNHDGPHTISVDDYHNHADQYGHWQSIVAVQEQFRRSLSPYRPDHAGKGVYPEPEVDTIDEDRLHAGPYYGTDQLQSPVLANANGSPRHMGQRAVAMSRSQSARSEVVDLTEDSDAEPDELTDDMSAAEESDADELRYETSPLDHQSGEEEGDDDQEDAEEDEEGRYRDEEMSEEELDDEENYHKIRHPGHYSVNGEQDDENMYEEEGELSYDEEESEEDYASTAIKRPPGGELEVIDLLSSDDEEGGEDADSGNLEEIKEGHVAKDAAIYSENEVESDLDPDADAELGEEGDDEEDNEGDDDGDNGDDNDVDRLAERASEDEDNGSSSQDHYAENGVEPVLTSKPEEFISSSPSEDVENRGADESGQPIVVGMEPLIALTIVNEYRSDTHIGDRKQSETPRKSLGGNLGGLDGAADMAPPEGEIMYPTLPLSLAASEEEPISQRLAERYFLHRESNNQEEPVDKEPLSLDSLSQRFASQESLTQESTDQGVGDQPLNLELVNRRPPTQQDDSQTSPANTQDEVTQEDFPKISPRNDQLPTPDATQVTAVFGPEVSFESNDGILPSTPQRLREMNVNEAPSVVLDISPSTTVDESTTLQDYDASAELAMTVIDSPTKQHQIEPKFSNAALRVKLTRPLQTSLGDFTPLKLVRFHLEQKLDVLAIVTTQPPVPQRAKSGPRHYHVRFHVTDASIAPSSVIAVHIFRPFMMAIPVVQPGQGVLLRNFIVKSERGGFMLRSDDSSSWVVFKDKGEEEVRGPPVEYGDGEREHISNLKKWFGNLDARSRGRLEKANAER